MVEVEASAPLPVNDADTGTAGTAEPVEIPEPERVPAPVDRKVVVAVSAPEPERSPVPEATIGEVREPEPEVVPAPVKLGEVLEVKDPEPERFPEPENSGGPETSDAEASLLEDDFKSLVTLLTV